MKWPRLPRLRWPRGLDPWDVAGGCGVGLVDVGVWRLAGWPWASILVGLVIVALYVVVARARAHERAGKENAD